MVDHINRSVKIKIIENQEKRTEEINELENFFKKLLTLMEEELSAGKKIGNWDYNNKTEIFMKNVQNLNTELRKIKEEIINIGLKNSIDQLLGLEKQNFEKTISIFQSKIKRLDLIQKTQDFTKMNPAIIEIDRSIQILDEQQKEVRESINDLICEIKYSQY